MDSDNKPPTGTGGENNPLASVDDILGDLQADEKRLDDASSQSKVVLVNALEDPSAASSEPEKSADGDELSVSGPENNATQSASPSAEKNAAAAKVELDLEDAPFLAEEAPPKPQPQQQATPPPAPGASGPAPPKASAVKRLLASLLANKKRLGMASAAALIILLAPLLFFLFTGPKAPSKPETAAAPAPAPAPSPTPPPAPAEPQGAPSSNFLYKAEPFLVERRGSEGEIRFLRCRFTIPVNNERLFAEMQAKSIILRDAIYHYLSNKPLTLLSDKTQQDLLRSDLISIINEQVTADKIDELFFEEYFVSGG